MGEDGYRYKKAFFEKLPIPKMVGTLNQQVIESANENINIEKNCLLLFNFSEDEIKEKRVCQNTPNSKKLTKP